MFKKESNIMVSKFNEIKRMVKHNALSPLPHDNKSQRTTFSISEV
jgi:hypothetical protein